MIETNQAASFIKNIKFDNSPRNNLVTLITECQFRFPYDVNDWSDPNWNITSYEKKTIASRAKQYRLIFALTSSRKGSQKDFEQFDSDWAGLIKSLLSVRFLERNVGYGPQHTLLIAFRYLYQVCKEKSIAIENIQGKDFVQAAERLKKREAPSTCYRIGNSLELLSKMMDRFFLTKIKINFVSPFVRTDEYDPLSERTFGRSASLQLSEEAIESIVVLNNLLKSPEDRLIIETLKMLLFTGLRVSELLSLERNCLVIKVENGEEFVGLRYYPQKGGHQVTRIKWLGELTGKLVKNTIYEIQKLTLEAHEVCRWLTIHPDLSYFRILLPQHELKLKDIAKAIGTHSISSTATLLIKQGIHSPYTVEKFDAPFRPSNENMIAFKDSKTGYVLPLEKALFVTFQDSYAKYKLKKVYFPELLTEGTFMLVLGGKEDKKHPRLSIFDEYDLKDKKGNKIHVTTHMFRRFLNTIYNEGGVPLTILSKVFGRKNSKDTLSYIYTTPKKRTEDARKLFKEGGMIGPKASLIRKIPIHQRDSAINTLVESVHHLGFGYCCHDWSTLHCEKHIQCLDNCVDFHMDINDPKTKEYLKEQIEKAEDATIFALAEAQDETIGATAQVDHYQRISENAKKYLNDMEAHETFKKKND